MTSMPASRSARAMILAPRSWPSRPGFATTTRILRPPPPAPDSVASAEASMGWRSVVVVGGRWSVVGGRWSVVGGRWSCELKLEHRPPSTEHLEHRRFRVRPEDFLQRGHDFALAGVHARAVQQRFHQVGVVLRLFFEARERGFDLDAAPAAADRLEAVDLLALERGVDAQGLDRLLV